MESQNIRPGHLTAIQAREVLGGISAGALRNLVYRGRLKRSGGTDRYPYFAAKDVTAILAERRERASA